MQQYRDSTNTTVSQANSFRFRKDPSSFGQRRQQTKKKSFIDTKVLENATEEILKIVHRGKSENAREAREREREKIKEHVLRTMTSRIQSKRIRFCYRTLCLPSSSEGLAKRTREREEKKLGPNLIDPKLPDEEEHSADESIRHFSFAAPADISGLNEAVKKRANQATKHVSFLSPEKSFNSFKTPCRPSPNSRFSKPPPLFKQKRSTSVVDETLMPDQRLDFVLNSSPRTFQSAPRAPDAPYDLLGIGLTESIFN